MTIKGKRKYKGKKKYRTRKPRSTAILNALTPVGQVIAPSAIVNLRFSDFVTIDPGAATAQSVIYRANSVYDPRHAALGTQPLGFDQWSTFYDHYVVTKSTITVRFVPSAVTPVTGSAIVGLSVQDDATTTAIIPLQLIERQGSSWGIMTGADAGGVKVLKKSFHAKKFFGVSDLDDNIAKIGANVGANPSEQAYFHVSAGAVDASSNPAPMTAIIQVDYTVKFVERKSLLQS